MRIIYYSAHPQLNLTANTGYGTHMREVINGFQNHGHEVETLIIGGKTKLSDENLITAPTSPFKQKIKHFIPNIIWETLKDLSLLKKDKKSFQSIDQLIQDFKPDFIYERGYYLLKSGLTASLKHNIPHFIELNAPYVEERVKFSGKSLLLAKAIKAEIFQLKNATALVVVSSALKKHFTDKITNIEHKILVTPNAINPNKIVLDTVQQQNIKDKHDLNNKKIIGFVGSIFPYHGVDILIKAFAQIENNTNCKLLIVGDGHILDSLKELSKKLNIDQNVIFTGKVNHDKVFDYIEIMDITVMPQSNWYGSPVKIFEYGYLKKVVIAPNYIPLTDVLQQNKNGIMIPPSVENLKEELEKTINDPIFSKKLGNQFHTDILNNYTWDKVSEKILNFKQQKWHLK